MLGNAPRKSTFPAVLSSQHSLKWFFWERTKKRNNYIFLLSGIFYLFFFVAMFWEMTIKWRGWDANCVFASTRVCEKKKNESVFRYYQSTRRLRLYLFVPFCLGCACHWEPIVVLSVKWKTKVPLAELKAELIAWGFRTKTLGEFALKWANQMSFPLPGTDNL